MENNMNAVDIGFREIKFLLRILNSLIVIYML